MDFFASQERAEKQTRLMLLLFVMAVICIVLSTNLVGAAIYIVYAHVPAPSIAQALYAVPHPAYWLTTTVVLSFIAFGSLSRMSDLSGGGAAVAEMVGARQIKSDGSDIAERRLINVVEEMAIASGIRMPLVYVMDNQHGINAFAAGYSLDQAAVTVTRGALNHLSRDELQGVVAHEFSHILNGDMRLNIRLIGVIAGIVVIGGIGRALMRTRGSRNPLPFWGFLIWLIGSVGVFFGSLIKAAISRQREFLADASAVQFTRNPDGIASALYKISLKGSAVSQRYADELSHMYFGSAVDSFFATHPPMEERIEQIMGPGAIYLLKDRIKEIAAETDTTQVSRIVDTLISPIPTDLGDDGIVQFGDSSQSPSGTDKLRVTPTAVMSSVGTLSPAHIDYARHLIEQLPAEVRRAIGTEAGAKAALFSLVLGHGEVRRHQLDLVFRKFNQMMAIETGRLADLLQPLGIGMRMPVFEFSMASLRSLDTVEDDEIIALMEEMISADNKVTLAEFVLLTLCRSHLKPAADGPGRIKYQTIQGVSKEIAAILSLLLRAEQVDPEVYARVVSSLALPSISQNPVSSITFQAVEAALGELKLLAPQGKATFIKACLEIVLEDGQITVTEGELMRAICAALEVPLPPIIEVRLRN
jgi:Zn-dependent protease with chaperone function/uncharacterized tellurite resistance protein B-like protein